MFDIAQNQHKEYKPYDDKDLVFIYRPVPHCYGLEVQRILSESVKGLVSKHYGDPAKAEELARVHTYEAMIQHQGELMFLLLQVCLRGVKGVKGLESIDLEQATVGGINTKVVPRDVIDIMLDTTGLDQEVANFYDFLKSQQELSDEDKKKSRTGDAGANERVSEPVSNVSVDVQKAGE